MVLLGDDASQEPPNGGPQQSLGWPSLWYDFA